MQQRSRGNDGLPDRFEYRHSKELRKQGDAIALSRALKHQDVQKSRHLRAQVIEDLGKVGSPTGVPALIEVLAEDPDDGSRMYAAIALGRIDDPRGLSALRSGMGDPEQAVRLWAIESLGHRRDRESVDRLIACLRDEDSWIRGNSARALGRIGDQRATFPLLERLGDLNGSVRKASASALVALGDSRSLKPLREAYERTGYFQRRPLGKALRELENRFQ